ncbi:MAG: PIN domain-containing protein [Pseudomonadota bacterium]
MPQTLDLNKHSPIKDELYFVDSNVWFWTTYVTSKHMALPQPPQEYQTSTYPAFLEKILNEGAKLCHCPLTLAELANVIENTELDFYREAINNIHFEKKAFRQKKDARQTVLKEIEVAWETMNSMSKCLDIKLDLTFSENSRKIMAEGTVDPFDAFFIQVMRDNKIDYVVTDDRDFCTVNKQIVITANRKALK